MVETRSAMNEESNRLSKIYARIKELKAGGVKMKEMAEAVELAPSVFSAMSSTVLPLYQSAIEQGRDHQEAIDSAIAQVNNVSKRRLLGNLDKIYSALMKFKCGDMLGDRGDTLVETISLRLPKGKELGSAIEGLYICYRQSEDLRRELVAEPYLLRREEGTLEFYIKRVDGRVVQGIALHMGEGNISLMSKGDGVDSSKLEVTMVRLSAEGYYSLIRGITLGYDSSDNPLSRRVVLVRLSDSREMECLEELEAKVVARDDNQLLYDYLCSGDDAIRLYSLPNHTVNFEDLSKEKEIISILSR